MTANREHKDSLFKILFSDPKELIKLYNALTGENLPLDTKIEFATLTDILFDGLQNDIAFLLGDIFIILIEHQPTLTVHNKRKYAAAAFDLFGEGIRKAYRK